MQARHDAPKSTSCPMMGSQGERRPVSLLHDTVPPYSTLGVRSRLDPLAVLENPRMLEDLVQGKSCTGVDDEQLVTC